MSAGSPYTAAEEQTIDNRDWLESANNLFMMRHFFEEPSRITDYMQENCTMATVGGTGRVGTREKLNFAVYISWLQGATSRDFVVLPIFMWYAGHDVSTGIENLCVMKIR